MTKPMTLDDIAALMEKGFAAVAEDITDIKATMATKDDVVGLRTELKNDIAGVRAEMATKDDIAGLRSDIRAELKEIRRELENVKGFGKEIDHALERIHAIEKHLGIEYKIAA